MKKISENPDLVDFLADYNFEVIDIIKTLRKIIYKKYEDIEEKVNFELKSILYHHPISGYIIGIFPIKDYVKLSFGHGDLIVDRYKIFDKKSEDKIKYVKFKHAEEIDEDIINDYIGQSVLIKKKRISDVL
ncbi:MAG: DUF1801 domain-containing protein [Candidatus Woesearchaeota archaeon]|jgi:hypothetical protein|nr:DUF1801 domain-containing protein [Candidatus Woesearchaeota archaeon]